MVGSPKEESMNEIIFTEGTFELATPDGQLTIDAVLASNGLAYHLTHYSDCNGPDYSVSHQATGCCIGEGANHFKTPEQCESFIQRIDGFTDWTQGMNGLFGRFKTMEAKGRWIKKMQKALRQAIQEEMQVIA
jgi:hypothetical protein